MNEIQNEQLAGGASRGVDPAVISATRDEVNEHGVDSLVVDDLTADDLPDIAWSGGVTHVESVAEKLSRVAAGEIEYLAVRAPNGQPIAKACVDYGEHPGASVKLIKDL